CGAAGILGVTGSGSSRDALRPRQGQSVSPNWTAAPNSRVQSVDPHGEFPAGAILVDAQFMAGSEMPPEHLGAPAAFQADDIIAVNRSADRHRGFSLSVEFGYRFTKSCESLMNSQDQDRQLVRPNLVAADICSNDVGR